jgi:hypothetical protein
MKTFIQYLQATDRFDEGLMDFFRGKKHVEPTPPPDDPSPFAKWQAMQKKTPGLGSTFVGDPDKPRDAGEEKVMLSMRRSKKR